MSLVICFIQKKNEADILEEVEKIIVAGAYRELLISDGNGNKIELEEQKKEKMLSLILESLKENWEIEKEESGGYTYFIRIVTKEENASMHITVTSKFIHIACQGKNFSNKTENSDLYTFMNELGYK